MITIAPGQSFFADSEKNAYKIREGNAEVFVVPEEQGVQGRPLHIMDAGEGDTLPGINYTDAQYSNWKMMINAVSSCSIQIIEGGCTKVLQRRFLKKAAVAWDGETDFEQQLIEEYQNRVITDDVFILKTEKQRKQLQDNTEASILNETQDLDAGKGVNETSDEKRALSKAEFSEPLDIKSASGAAAIIALMLLLGAGAMMCLLREQIVFAGILSLLFAAAGLGFSYYISRCAEKRSEKLYEKTCRQLFGAGSLAGNAADRREAAAALIGLDAVVRNELWTKWEALAAVLLSVAAAIILIAAAAGIALPIVAGAAAAGIIVYAAKGRMNSSAGYRGRAEADLHQFFGNIEKIRLAGAEEYAIDKYFRQVKLGEAEERYNEMTGLLTDTVAKAVCWIVPAAAAAYILIHPAAEGSGETIFLMAAGAVTAAAGISFALKSAEHRHWKARLAYTLSCLGVSAEDVETPAPDLSESSAEDKDSEAGKIPAVEMRHVDFAYGDRMILKDVSFSVYEKEIACISGPSGCGKSTVIRLLTGEETPLGGCIYYNGTQAGEHNFAKLRQKMGIVIQNDQLLPGSIEENIRCGNMKITHKEIFGAMADADLLDDVMEMPMKTETLIGEDGDVISSGQKQKVLLARAFARDPEILILDEACSELDLETQEKIISSIIRRGITCIMVTHDEEVRKLCDNVIEINCNITGRSV